MSIVITSDVVLWRTGGMVLAQDSIVLNLTVHVHCNVCQNEPNISTLKNK